MVIIEQANSIHGDIKTALDVIIVEVKGSSGSLYRIQLWPPGNCAEIHVLVERYFHSLPGSILKEQSQIIGIAVVL